MKPTVDRIPRTDELLSHPLIVSATARLGRTLVKCAINEAQKQCRSGDLNVTAASVVEAVLQRLPETAGSLHSVINATGVILHTNLGRAPLSDAAVAAVAHAAGPTDVELDLATGRRGPRGRGAMVALAAAIPTAEDVHVVNNNAAALALVATAFAQGRHIVISRGELVEIGDGFRLPDLLESTGARLREVGTTNRVTAADYVEAIDADVGFVLKVHPSNFLISGFTASVPVQELTDLGVPVIVDIGSGLLTADQVLPAEPDATDTLRAGAALVTASGDKLLGGPQCGILAGRSELITRLRRHPLARALRVDKLTLAALEATVAGPPSPTAEALHADAEDLFERACALAATCVRAGIDARAVRCTSVVGGGGAPGVELPSAALSLPADAADRLRAGRPPVLGRVERRRCLLDLRAVPPAADDDLRTAVLSRCTS